MDSEVRAAAWLDTRLLFSTAGPHPKLTIGTIDLDKQVFVPERELGISFSPNFALSYPDAEQVLFGEVGGRVAVFDASLAHEYLLPLRRPHTLTVRHDGSTAQLIGAFEPQKVEVLEWPFRGPRDFRKVPAAIPIALTETFLQRHSPNIVLKVFTGGADDFAVVVQKKKISVVRMHNGHIKVLMKHPWSNLADTDEDFRKALCAIDIVDDRIMVVVATRNHCVQFDILERRFTNLGGELKARDRPNDVCHFESLVLRGERLFCSASCSKSESFFLFAYNQQSWQDITGNNQIMANHAILLKDKEDVDFLMLFPTGVEVPTCSLFNLREKIINTSIDISTPIIFDVSDKGKRLALVHGQCVKVYEFETCDQYVEYKEMVFEGETTIHALRFIPDSENLLSILFNAKAFSDLKLSIWDIGGKNGKDIFEIDVRNAITSFNFFERQQLSSRIFWSLETETAWLLTERSLVRIDLKTLKSTLELGNDWFLGSQANYFDVHKSFVSDKNIYLVFDNAEMFWLQRY